MGKHTVKARSDQYKALSQLSEQAGSSLEQLLEEALEYFIAREVSTCEGCGVKVKKNTVGYVKSEFRVSYYCNKCWDIS